MNAPDTPPSHDVPGAPLVRTDIRSLSLFVLATVACVFALREMQEVVVPIILAALLFYALAPTVNLLVRWRLPRALAASIVMVTLVSGLGGMAYSLSDEAIAVMQSLPDTAARLQRAVRGLRRQNNDSLTQMQKAATALESTATEAMGASAAPRGVMRVQVVEPSIFRVSDYLLSGSRGIMLLAGELTTIFFLAFFMLLSSPRIKEIVVDVAGPTLTKRHVTTQIVDEITDQVQRFLIILVSTGALVAVATALALWPMGLNYPVLWGVVAGVMNSVPYFGPVVVTGGLAAVAFVQFGALWPAASVAGVALLITSLEGFLLTPLWQGRVARMNSVAVFVGLLFWSWMWGPIGLLLAVPLTTVVKVICDHVEDLHPVGRLLGE
jgi:predicted PurR-regulated permease PerM